MWAIKWRRDAQAVGQFTAKQRWETEKWLMHPVKQEERDFMKEKQEWIFKGKDKPLPDYMGAEGVEFDIPFSERRDKETQKELLKWPDIIFNDLLRENYVGIFYDSKHNSLQNGINTFDNISVLCLKVSQCWNVWVETALEMCVS